MTYILMEPDFDLNSQPSILWITTPKSDFEV